MSRGRILLPSLLFCGVRGDCSCKCSVDGPGETWSCSNDCSTAMGIGDWCKTTCKTTGLTWKFGSPGGGIITSGDDIYSEATPNCAAPPAPPSSMHPAGFFGKCGFFGNDCGSALPSTAQPPSPPPLEFTVVNKACQCSVVDGGSKSCAHDCSASPEEWCRSHCRNAGTNVNYDPGSSSSVCFGRERAAACRLLDDGASATAAHSACWGANESAAAAAAALVPMSELVAGDLVLTEKGGDLFVDRVVVNQHREAASAGSAALLTLIHAAGSLTVTPKHFMWLDGGFMPARSATVGSLLSNGHPVTAITESMGGIINPIVAGGTILASDKAGGAPVLAATADEWMADVLLSAYPKYSPSLSLAIIFPEAAQAYYDDALEPLFNAAVPTFTKFKAAAPAPLVGLVIVAGDAVLVAGLGVYALGFKGAATLAVAALAAVATRRAARK
eukprot:CAMPEP_0119057656 /NCGR_PEP_ID=MMETSP1178-20130426/2078_1 /TAXON_ID=33656 /ORGANISM="unid sp, Strain CCMP2000" /LENGTH=443 /DNA_ID=CAMNT_0007038511 /DNA_START=36 /DNA_END=1367 /DNA_ORIENTATION=+